LSTSPNECQSRLNAHLTIKEAQAIFGLSAPVSFHFDQAQFVGVVGSNGAGKSSLLRLFCGLNHTKGEILISDVSLKYLTHLDRAQRIAYLPQSPPLSPHWTVEEVLKQGLYPHLHSSHLETVERELSELSDRLHLTPLLKREIAYISGGERQRTLIARTLAQSTPIMILDEPLSALDWHTQEIIIRELKYLCEQRQTLIIASIHELNLASLYTDELIMLRDGDVINTGPTTQMMTEEHINHTFMSQVRALEHPTDHRYQQLPWGIQR
jgi:iron complex transport system ATP-binding protein